MPYGFGRVARDFGEFVMVEVKNKMSLPDLFGQSMNDSRYRNMDYPHKADNDGV